MKLGQVNLNEKTVDQSRQQIYRSVVQRNVGRRPRTCTEHSLFSDRLSEIHSPMQQRHWLHDFKARVVVRGWKVF